jgi:hypothetical protein
MKRFVWALAAIALVLAPAPAFCADKTPLANYGGGATPLKSGDTVPVSHGGTGAASASGTAIDNISGFASTGFLTRTGAGAYSFQSLTNGISLGNIAQIAANTVVGNATASTANMVAQSMPSCSAASSALTWTTSSGFGCNTIAGGGGSPGGSSGQIQYNDAGAFGGFTLANDCTISVPNITCTKLNSVSPGYFFSGTDAANLTGTVSAARIASGSLSLAKIASAAANSKLVGSGAAGSGSAYAEITLGSGLTMTGTTLSASGGSGTVTTTGSPASGNLAKFSGSTSITNTTVSAFLDSEFSSTQGSVLYRGASAWSALAPGTSGYVLATGGASANPSWAAPATVVTSGGGAIAQTFLQDTVASTATNVTSFTVTFPQTTASSGNTAFLIIATDGSQAITAPAGWTVDINQTQATYSRLMVLHKATASDTTATFTAGSTTSFSAYFFEMVGTHALDQSSLGGQANATYTAFPAITPSAGAIVFAVTSQVANSVSGSTFPPVITGSPYWHTFYSIGPSPQQRLLMGHITVTTVQNASIKPPILNNSSQALFPSGGIAYATFSIL